MSVDTKVDSIGSLMYSKNAFGKKGKADGNGCHLQHGQREGGRGGRKMVSKLIATLTMAKNVKM